MRANSTTARIEVMACLVYENGIILELEGTENILNSSLRSFNCALVSCAVHEEEILFCGGYDSIANYQCFMDALQLLDKILNAESNMSNANEQNVSKIVVYEREYNIVKMLMDKNEGKLPEYVTRNYILDLVHRSD